MKTFPTLYKRAKSGEVLLWWMDYKPETGEYRTCSCQKNGKVKIKAWTQPEAKNVGKSNASTPQSQGLTEIEAKYVQQRKDHYFDSEKDIDRKLFFVPMLAEKFADVADKIIYPAFMQRKFNGIRCINHGEGYAENGAGAFSRTGEEFFCIDHIKEEIEDILNRFPRALTDGELFKYGVPLNEIASLVSVNTKLKDVTPERLEKAKRIIEYHIYDGFGFFGVTQESPFSERHEALKSLLKDYTYLKAVETFKVNSNKEAKALLDRFLKEKYEGGILRIDDPYYNDRCDSLIKMKKFHDEEYEVVDILASKKGDWGGKAKKIVCRLPAGSGKDGASTFESNIRGTMPEMEKLFKEKDRHIGKMATVTYQELSPYGVPLIPYTELPFRDYETKK